MKHLLLIGGLVLSSGARAQIIGRPIKSYTTRMGTSLNVGDSITFASGQRENGSFKYASIASQAFHQAEESLPATWNYRKAVIKGLREMPYKTGPVVTVIFKAGAYNAALNADSAEESGEIKTTNNQKKATPTSGGVADELLKLKGLLDSGVITQAEFDTQKAKLLK